MNKRKIIKYILIAVPVLFLAKWYIETAYYNSNKTPERNPNPQEKLRIYGKFPLDSNKYYIKASVRYIATNPKCDNDNWFEGARFAQAKGIDVNASMSNGYYEINIFNDRYKFGRCEWQVGEIGIETILKNTNKGLYYLHFVTTRSITTDDILGQAVLENVYSPLNLTCNFERISTDYTRYFCNDSSQTMFFPNSQKEFELNFDQMAEPTQTIKQGEK